MYTVVLGHIKAAASHIVSKLAYPSVRILLKVAAIAVGMYLMFEVSVKGKIVTAVYLTLSPLNQNNGPFQYCTLDYPIF